MNRIHTITFRLLSAFLVLGWCFTIGTLAQGGLESAPPLPAGMTGSNANDPRAKLTPGLFDAGETSNGMKHLTLLKKPDVRLVEKPLERQSLLDLCREITTGSGQPSASAA